MALGRCGWHEYNFAEWKPYIVVAVNHLGNLLCVFTTVLLLLEAYVELDNVSPSGVLGRHVASDTRLDTVKG
jgi:hypothetical protein